MKKLTDQELIEKLSELREQAVESIKKYNILARENNQNTRMAYATAHSWAEDEEDDIDNDELEETNNTDFYENKIKEITANKNKPQKRKTNFEKLVNESYGENVGISITAPESEYWFPSAICN
jgi:pullulanase/glycogen debranching enzyme